MTKKQIPKLVASLVEHQTAFSSLSVEDAQWAISNTKEAISLFASAVQNRVKKMKISDFIVRTAKVNRTYSRQEALDATGRTQYTDRNVVDTMPKGEGDEVEVVFFKPDLSERNGFISDDGLEMEFKLRGLKPADPVSVAAVNEAYPTFADNVPHGTHWKDSYGNWCYAAFSRFDGERRVSVCRRGPDWRDYWWFAGVRK